MEEKSTNEKVNGKESKLKPNAIVIKKSVALFLIVYPFILMMLAISFYDTWMEKLHPSHTVINGYNSDMIIHAETQVDIPKESNVNYIVDKFSLRYRGSSGTIFVHNQEELKTELYKAFDLNDEMLQEDQFLKRKIDAHNEEFFKNNDLAIIYFNGSNNDNFITHNVEKIDDTIVINMARLIRVPTSRRVHVSNQKKIDYAKSYSSYGDYVSMSMISLEKGANNVEFNLFEPLLEKIYDSSGLRYIATIIYIGIVAFVLVLIKLHNKHVNKKTPKIKSVLRLFLICELFIAIGLGAYALYQVYIPLITSEDYMVKPIIYIYPEEETKVNVKLGKPENITCDYPEYEEEGWTVNAKPNGDLKYLKTGRNLYALYYESKATIDAKVQKDGFIVKGEDALEFLEEKLEILGLNEREAEEFIVYWLPILEENKYNYIRFETEEEINVNMPLEITPEPDSIIRVMMTYKGLDRPIDVEEQKLTTPERKGFAVVEWGGTKIER